MRFYGFWTNSKPIDAAGELPGRHFNGCTSFWKQTELESVFLTIATLKPKGGHRVGTPAHGRRPSNGDAHPVSGMGILVADKVKQDSVVLLQAPWLPTPQFQSPTFRIPPPLTHSVSVLTISWLGPSVPQSRLQLATVRQPNAAWLAVAN
jgi:hypothetical protein